RSAETRGPGLRRGARGALRRGPAARRLRDPLAHRLLLRPGELSMRHRARIVVTACLLHAATALAATGSARPAPPSPRVVPLTAADGMVLRATYYPAGRPGPGVILFHQSNRNRKSWAPVARALAAAGIHALALDLRGFGDSDGTRYATLTRQEIGRARARWP